MRISGLTHAASAPALLRFAFRVATHAQGWLPAGWLAFTGRASNPLDHYERFQITWSSPFPVLLTLDSCRVGRMLTTAGSGHKRTCAQQKILEALVVLGDQKSPIIAVRLGFIWRMPEQEVRSRTGQAMLMNGR